MGTLLSMLNLGVWGLGRQAPIMFGEVATRLIQTGCRDCAQEINRCNRPACRTVSGPTLHSICPSLLEPSLRWPLIMLGQAPPRAPPTPSNHPTRPPKVSGLATKFIGCKTVPENEDASNDFIQADVAALHRKQLDHRQGCKSMTLLQRRMLSTRVLSKDAGPRKVA